MTDFDRGLYDAVMAEAPDNPYERDLWAEAADMAARISAERQQDDGLDAVGGFSPQATYPVDIAFERQQVTVSDEGLASIFADAIECSHTRNPARPDGQHIIAGIRAVRTAIENAKETTNE